MQRQRPVGPTRTMTSVPASEKEDEITPTFEFPVVRATSRRHACLAGVSLLPIGLPDPVLSTQPASAISAAAQASVLTLQFISR
jgi:hypothetical protein